ncbi:ABC transporter [Flavipsychrobacter stenotrophus]|uniref:ABC transporter n=1 Tax=Flavipsychrobacter stenotrophus TaxID=2077091 RepID=A0A2S7SY83_9BACT|nr:ATP-binding cassette domain-containing protein [Flavipsychrobacter stenotrophus]PQJ11658.1 ABC transporter [Flavipsychrobacter stenotrophus]
MIRFKKYSKEYNGQLIIKADMALDGPFYWLKGENGSGKSTLFKSIAGLIPFSGQIEVEGIDINKDRIGYRMIVNHAEAEPSFPTFLTGTELVDFYTTTKKADKQHVAKLIAALGIGVFVGNKTGTYSSGMLKKLSLVLGFIGHPKLILLDEPLITLDQASVSNLILLIENAIDSGIAVIITSHQQLVTGKHTSSKLSITDHALIEG